MENLNQISWRHHYIPQFYLNGFTSSKGKFKIFDVEKRSLVRSGKDFSTRSFFFEKMAILLLMKTVKMTSLNWLIKNLMIR